MNKEQALEKRQIKEHVKVRLEKGEPKQQILEEMSQLYRDRVTIVKLLEQTPSKVMRHKFRMHNYGLAVLLAFVLVLDTILFFQLTWGTLVIDFTIALNIALSVVFLTGVLLFRIEIYSWIASSAVVTLITLIAWFYYHGIHDINPLLYVSLSLIVISFILGLLLGVQLCPSRVPKSIEVDVDGIEKITKTVYVFPD